jgi:hypothetical protein
MASGIAKFFTTFHSGAIILPMTRAEKLCSKTSGWTTPAAGSPENGFNIASVLRPGGLVGSAAEFFWMLNGAAAPIPRRAKKGESDSAIQPQVRVLAFVTNFYANAFLWGPLSQTPACPHRPFFQVLKLS